MSLVLTPLPGMPLVKPGDDLASLVLSALEGAGLACEDGDLFVVTQKIISKAEGRLVNLAAVSPCARALHLAQQTGKDPRLIELILGESREVLRTRPGTIIVEHRLGFVCANAGIDHSNVAGVGDELEEWVLLLPENPDESARQLRQDLEAATGKRLGVLVIDSHGRAWRMGTVGVAIGLSGLPGLVDLRGELDLFGYTLRITQVGAADELAAAASLMMGQAAEGTPVVHVRGFPYPLREGALPELLRPRVLDMFR
jgi:coenzyme F420-0:L-glutamate ligase/coenzyme F420-1:gamma-L-glutamate ligase